MKKMLLILFSIIAALLPAAAQTGAWTGDLNVQGARLPLVFHLDDANPTLDSPAQGAKGIPAKIARPAPDSICVSIPVIRAEFTGKYENDEITGIFSQSGMSFPLRLTPGEKTVQRPQTPRPPYPYSQEEVSFASGEAVLSGTLTLPEGCSRRTPAVVMITGSGLQNRDEEIFDHKPFAVIADALARKGIASLRYDDRGFGKSTGNAAAATTEAFMQDALAGNALLRQRFDKVGALGHSEGGTIALMMGADGFTDFVVSLAGMSVSGRETLLDQNRRLLSEAGYAAPTVEEYCTLLISAFDNDTSVDTKRQASSLPYELKRNLQAAMKQLQTPYMQHFLTLDIRERLGNVACPVLALNGTKDTQVACEENLAALKQGLPSNPGSRISASEGLNHLFQHCSTGNADEYSRIEETISPDVLDTITGWINSL